MGSVWIAGRTKAVHRQKPTRQGPVSTIRRQTYTGYRMAMTVGQIFIPARAGSSGTKLRHEPSKGFVNADFSPGTPFSTARKSYLAQKTIHQTVSITGSQNCHPSRVLVLVRCQEGETQSPIRSLPASLFFLIVSGL